MRICTLALIFFPVAVTIADDKAVKPLTPAEASKKVNEKVIVEMVVKSTGGKINLFLNSEEDYKSEKNFLVFIPEDQVEKFKKAKIEDPTSYYKGKTIQVSGTVILYRDKPEIKIDSPDQIKVVEKKSPPQTP